MTKLFFQIFNTDITTENCVSKNDLKNFLGRLVKALEHLFSGKIFAHFFFKFVFFKYPFTPKNCLLPFCGAQSNFTIMPAPRKCHFQILKKDATGIQLWYDIPNNIFLLISKTNIRGRGAIFSAKRLKKKKSENDKKKNGKYLESFCTLRIPAEPL